MLRFQRDARRVLRHDLLHDVPFHQYLQRGWYGHDFRQRVIIPLPDTLPLTDDSRTRSGPIMACRGGRTHERHPPAYHR